MNAKTQLNVKITAENKCSFCHGAKCCHYVTQQIETPRSKYDFEHLLWQVSHEGIEIYKDTDGWYMIVSTSCTHLLDDGCCGIYEKRPQICRDHDNDWCEFDEPPEKHWKLHFPDYDSLHQYCTKRFKRWQR
ncbi:MAG: YkgJ family cysteine cluster protein [Gammaproteobacteria bacterium]|nr:MAG: YkgJ family cysteine cluster protein [Gammaproteobacteria bacterium]